MRKTNPGVDRIEMTTLRADRARIVTAMTLHTQHCQQCHQAHTDVWHKCSDWWEIAVELHRIRRLLKAMELPPEAFQEPLPGMP